MKIAARDPDFDRDHKPLSLMKYAGQVLIIPARLERYDNFRFSRPRSDLSCHHVMIACAIGGGSPFEVQALRGEPITIYGEGKHSAAVEDISRGGYTACEASKPVR